MGNVYMEADQVRFKDSTYRNVQEGLAAALEGGGGGTAADVSYDNTDSGLTAETVQAAIDEVVTDLGSLSTIIGDSTAGLVKEVTDIQDLIPYGATSENKLATASDIPGYEGEYVSVTPVTDETFSNLLSRLYALIDFSKLTINSYLVIEYSSARNIYKRPTISTSAAVTFSAVISDAGDPGIDVIYMSSSSAIRKRGTILSTPAVKYTDMGAQTVQSSLVSVKIYY